eukprot:TRINITY_DN47318_c0_g1_i1.p1 TRINITY_DN47318_c0_g1~~TRINITY_DN47318_c0_g1_i1.p1  ORF type:complete len:338 (+),score=104.04 TRINITY_DN47318_c0_g1_i1:103-1116(+)
MAAAVLILAAAARSALHPQWALRRSVHVDVGDGAPWTTLESPPPQPPRKVRRQVGRSIYGGAQEAAHIGGWLDNDTKSYEPVVWEYMTRVVGAKSVLDIGCGRGIASKWFQDHGLRMKCIEATDEGVSRTALRNKSVIVQHDYTLGPWWPREVYDFAWCVEFVEHVEEKYMDNWFATMRAAHYVVMTHARRGGHHHVAMHGSWWWQEKFASRGFTYVPEMSAIVTKLSGWGAAGRGNHYVRQTGMVFRNDFNVMARPMLGPGSGADQASCAESFNSLKGSSLLYIACIWVQNPFIPHTKACLELCRKQFGAITPAPELAPPGWRYRPPLPRAVPPRK